MQRWDQIQEHTKIRKENFRRLLELCVFESGFFLYQDQYYKQIQGLPMGNPLSGILATFVLNDFLENFFKSDPPKNLCKYVDDMFLIMDKDSIETMLQHINEAHDTLKFTIERESDKKIPFLDTIVIREEDGVHTDWYKKPIVSGRLLNYLSAHPYDVNRGIATSFAKRVIRLSHRKYHTKNFEIIRDILNKNNYPQSIDNRIIKNIKFDDQLQTSSSQTPSTTNQDQIKFRGLPYVPILSDKIKRT